MVRYAVGAFGVLLIAIGGRLLWTGGELSEVAVWLAGAIVLHDGLIAPFVLTVGLLVASVPARGLVRGALIVAAALTAIALPPMLAPVRRNPSVLPLDYPRNWLLAMAAIAVVTALVLTARALRGRRPRRPSWLRTPRLRRGQ
ncbi:hypothetical protein [Streptomyces sp. MUM 178J]|uniref:hypothetical protein n=1 Tax=Streptomyces sp. MUM 178J TaxID=2791991 RepID=UPI001F0402D0|nr:hypothetical protein [Streptomyces sp. MUM 178J]WRQ80080.1 hypothetical protein I3F59_012365 [Streptomyces sp. MUM 178J]